jgi:hypothetical protein
MVQDYRCNNGKLQEIMKKTNILLLVDSFRCVFCFIDEASLAMESDISILRNNMLCSAKDDQFSIAESQLTKRRFVEKSGSLVKFTPSLRNPASSPGVGICVR